jgi:hypothetical protein
MDRCGSGQGQVGSTCEGDCEYSGSIACGEFFGVAEDLLPSQEGLCSLELDS